MADPGLVAVLHRLSLNVPSEYINHLIPFSKFKNHSHIDVFNKLQHRGKGQNDKNQNFFHIIGKAALAYCTMEYIKQRWPKLDVDGKRRGMTIYTCNTTLASLAKTTFGFRQFMEDFVIKEAGTARPTGKKIEAKKLRHKVQPIEQERIAHQLRTMQVRKTNNRYASTLCAMIGSTIEPIHAKNGIAFECGQAAQFISKYLLGGTVFNLRKLVQPEYPVVALTTYLRQEGVLGPDDDTVFRLLKESARYSADSMYQVGVFAKKSDPEPLGIGTPL